MVGDASPHWTIVYDGACRFCTSGAQRLARRIRGVVTLVDYNQPGALEPFPALSPEQCAAAMHLIDGAGRIYRGAEAGARALAARGPAWRWAMLYYLPGVRWASDAVYRVIAANRYRIAGRNGGCTSGACRRP